MDNQAKHICIVSPSLKMGGIERALTVLSNYFVSQGYEVTFISCLAGDKFYHLDQRIRFIEPAFKRTNSRLNKYFFYPWVAGFIRKMTRQANPYVVLTFGDWFGPLVLLALKGLSIPVYISDRTSPDYAFGFPVNLGKILLYPASAGFIAQTQRAADFKRKQFGDKLNIRIIPNAIREVKLYDIPREKIILYVGRFAWEKAPEKLIRAFALIADKKDWRLVMAGSGPMLESMKAYAKELGIGGSSEFLGKVDDVDALYAKASIYVLPSVLEGFPNSLCEAMAAGLPCICFDSIPTEALLTNNVDGLIVKGGDPEQLAIKIERLMQDEPERKRLGEKAAHVRERLNIEKIGPQVLDFILGLY